MPHVAVTMTLSNKDLLFLRQRCSSSDTGRPGAGGARQRLAGQARLPGRQHRPNTCPPTRRQARDEERVASAARRSVQTMSPTARPRPSPAAGSAEIGLETPLLPASTKRQSTENSTPARKSPHVLVPALASTTRNHRGSRAAIPQPGDEKPAERLEPPRIPSWAHGSPGRLPARRASRPPVNGPIDRERRHATCTVTRRNFDGMRWRCL